RSSARTAPSTTSCATFWRGSSAAPDRSADPVRRLSGGRLPGPTRVKDVCTALFGPRANPVVHHPPRTHPVPSSPALPGRRGALPPGRPTREVRSQQAELDHSPGPTTPMAMTTSLELDPEVQTPTAAVAEPGPTIGRRMKITCTRDELLAKLQIV